MTPEEQQNARLEEELDGARSDLRETLGAVEAKMEQEVERAEVAFSPKNLLRDNIVGACCLAGLFGFVVGSSKHRKVVGAAAVGALGYKLWSGLAGERSDEDGRDSGNS